MCPCQSLSSNSQRGPGALALIQHSCRGPVGGKGIIVRVPKTKHGPLCPSDPPFTGQSSNPQLTGPAKITRPWPRLWAPPQKSGTRWGACGTCSRHKLDSSAGYLCSSVSYGRMLAISEPSSSCCRFQGHNSVGNEIQQKYAQRLTMSS